MNKKRRNIHQRGMTLLEIMIVLAIIALIMVFLIGPRVLKALSKSESRSGCIESKQLAYDAYTEWRAETRKTCPGGLAECFRRVRCRRLCSCRRTRLWSPPWSSATGPPGRRPTCRTTA